MWFRIGQDCLVNERSVSRDGTKTSNGIESMHVMYCTFLYRGFESVTADGKVVSSLCKKVLASK